MQKNTRLQVKAEKYGKLTLFGIGKTLHPLTKFYTVGYIRSVLNRFFLMNTSDQNFHFMPLASVSLLHFLGLTKTLNSFLRCVEFAGFTSPRTQCCGSYGDFPVHCGVKAIVNGTAAGAPCSNPSQFISRDGGHYSDAANQWITNRIMDRAFSDHPVSIA